MLLRQRLVFRAAASAAIAGTLFMSATALAGNHTATRSLSEAEVDPGSQITVTIQAQDYGSFGRVSETLPAGWTYVDSTLSAAAVEQQGQIVRFVLLDDAEFSYTVTAPDEAGMYDFSGVLEDQGRVAEPVTGDSQVTVRAEAPEPAETTAPTTTSTPPPTSTPTQAMPPTVAPAVTSQADSQPPAPKPATTVDPPADEPAPAPEPAETAPDPALAQPEPAESSTPAPEPESVPPPRQRRDGLALGAVVVVAIVTAWLSLRWRRRRS